jgi:hypothetical protein
MESVSRVTHPFATHAPFVRVSDEHVSGISRAFAQNYSQIHIVFDLPPDLSYLEPLGQVIYLILSLWGRISSAYPLQTPPRLAPIQRVGGPLVVS